jgi:acetyl-CoA/propionyl-CoA carboxylase biotin carboxyl carrier protein
VCAEDAARSFLPAAGRILAYERPAGVRVDDGIEAGSVVDTSYDSLLAKVIVHGDDRPQALARLERALSGLNILGVVTTTGFLRGLASDPDVRAGRLDTGLIERRGVPAGPMPDDGIGVAAAMLTLADRRRRGGGEPFARVDGWRLGGVRAPSYWRVAVGTGEPVDVEVRPEYIAATTWLRDGRFAIVDRGEWLLAHDGDVTWIGHGGYVWPVRHVSAAEARAGLSDGELRAPMPGHELLVAAAVGDEVRTGDPVVVLESMKMELVMSAPVDGAVAAINVAVGDRVVVDQPLARVEAVSSP